MARKLGFTLSVLGFQVQAQAQAQAAVALVAFMVVVSISIAACTRHHRSGRHRRRRGDDLEEDEQRQQAEQEHGHFPGKVGFVFRKVMKLTLAKKVFLLQGRKKKNNNDPAEAEPLDQSNDNDGENDTLWRRNILMGEKCRPPNFSGAILYDDKGNRLPQFPNRNSNRSAFP